MLGIFPIASRVFGSWPKNAASGPISGLGSIRVQYHIMFLLRHGADVVSAQFSLKTPPGIKLKHRMVILARRCQIEPVENRTYVTVLGFDVVSSAGTIVTLRNT